MQGVGLKKDKITTARKHTFANDLRGSPRIFKCSFVETLGSSDHPWFCLADCKVEVLDVSDY